MASSQFAFSSRRGIAGVWRSCWLNQEKMDFLLGDGAVFNAFWNDVHLAGTKGDRRIP